MANPELACVVMSCGNEPGLERAVRSILSQDVPVETVVVNSGGGGAGPRLRAADVEVPVWECRERLNPGAARNRGVAMTSAPFVSFLAADCVALPGWAANRLSLHRAGFAAVASALTNATPGNASAEASFLLLFHTRMPLAPRAGRRAYGASYSRELLERHGGFREDLRTGEDSEFNARIAPIEVRWTGAVLTAHAGPQAVGALVAEHFGRGRRLVATERRRLGLALHRPAARRAIANIVPAARAARTLVPSPPRRLAVLALLPLGACAYAAGALAGGWASGAADGLRRVFAQVAVPSAGPSLRRRSPRLLAVVAVRDEIRRLPEFVARLAPHVDGIVALDDGSRDGSAEWLERHPRVLEVLRAPSGRDRWREMENHRRLVAAAVRHGAEWIVALDADEEPEPGFRARAERVIARGRPLGFRAYALRLRELWGDRRHFRDDGVWGTKTTPRLFAASAGRRFDERELHGYKAPMDAMLPGLERFPLADLEIHHLGMLTPQARTARRRRYEELDPDSRWQAFGYAYMTDERGLRLRAVEPDRGWVRWLRLDGARLATMPLRSARARAARAAARSGAVAKSALRGRALRLRTWLAAASMPSAGPSLPRRPVRLLALLAVRDQRELLPGWLASVGPQVDGIVALDDGSEDGSGDWLERQPGVLEVVRLERRSGGWPERDNYAILLAAALRHEPEWLISVDADERLEPGFRRRAERVIARGRRLGFEAYGVRIRELWDGTQSYRSDGLWARKAQPRLFAARADHELDPKPLHGAKAPLQVRRRLGYFPIADLEIHHLGMLTPQARAARRRRWEELDPDSRWQPTGYAYLTDPAGLRLSALRPHRGWVEWLRGALRRAG